MIFAEERDFFCEDKINMDNNYILFPGRTKIPLFRIRILFLPLINLFVLLNQLTLNILIRKLNYYCLKYFHFSFGMHME